MSQRKANHRFCAGRFVIASILSVLIFVSLSSTAPAANQVDFYVPLIDDTLRVGTATSIDVYLENDYILYGMSLGFKIWSPDVAYWRWVDIGGLGATTQCVELIGSSRLGDGSPFNMTGFLVTEYDVDETSPDLIMCGGVGTDGGGLQTGPLEHMYSMHFNPMAVGWPTVRTICIDSVFVPPNGAFVFVDYGGSANAPVTLWPNGGKCYPVGWCRCSPPIWDPDLPTEMTINYGETGSVILSATDMEGSDIIFGDLVLSGGSGVATLDDYGDGTCEISYTPVIDDVGNAITISVKTGDAHHPFEVMYPYVIDVTVEHNPLSLDCGGGYANGATNNQITKTDITVPAEPPFEGLVYSLISGQGEVDPETGEYSWTPGPTDIGLFAVVIGVTDGVYSAQCGFQIEVVDEACCPGDVNFTGDVNVGDAVSLLNYIFKGGPAPRVMNWADANADCSVNVGDVVYLIGYVFRSGPAPQLGCYY